MIKSQVYYLKVQSYEPVSPLRLEALEMAPELCQRQRASAPFSEGSSSKRLS